MTRRIKGPKASSNRSGLGAPGPEGPQTCFLPHSDRNWSQWYQKQVLYPSTGRSSQAFSMLEVMPKHFIHPAVYMAGVGCRLLDQRAELGLLTTSLLFKMMRVFGSFLFSAPRVTSSIYLHWGYVSLPLFYYNSWRGWVGCKTFFNWQDFFLAGGHMAILPPTGAFSKMVSVSENEHISFIVFLFFNLSGLRKSRGRLGMGWMGRGQ